MLQDTSADRLSSEVVQRVCSLVKRWITSGQGALDNPSMDIQRLLGSGYRAEDWNEILLQGQEILEDNEMTTLLDSVDAVGEWLSPKKATPV